MQASEAVPQLAQAPKAAEEASSQVFFQLSLQQTLFCRDELKRWEKDKHLGD